MLYPHKVPGNTEEKKCCRTFHTFKLLLGLLNHVTWHVMRHWPHPQARVTPKKLEPVISVLLKMCLPPASLSWIFSPPLWFLKPFNIPSTGSKRHQVTIPNYWGVRILMFHWICMSIRSIDLFNTITDVNSWQVRQFFLCNLKMSEAYAFGFVFLSTTYWSFYLVFFLIWRLFSWKK